MLGVIKLSNAVIKLKQWGFIQVFVFNKMRTMDIEQRPVTSPELMDRSNLCD